MFWFIAATSIPGLGLTLTSFLLVAGFRRLERGACHSCPVRPAVHIVACKYALTRSTCRQVRPVRMSVLRSSRVSLGTLISESNNRHVSGSVFVFNPKYSY